MTSFSNEINHNAAAIEAVRGDVKSNQDAISELPFKIESYTTCITDKVRDFARHAAKFESNAIGKKAIAQRQSKFLVLCASTQNGCENDPLKAVGRLEKPLAKRAEC